VAGKEGEIAAIGKNGACPGSFAAGAFQICNVTDLKISQLDNPIRLG
jgi:hypothetical protein